MSQTNFSLTVYDVPNAPNLNLTGNVGLQGGQLSIQYLVAGDLKTVIIPSNTAEPRRQYDLWEHTCCEFFLGSKNQSEYWEFNLAPSGDWNVFHFLRYRHNIAEEERLQSLPFTVTITAELLELNLTLDLDKFIGTAVDLEMGITAVIEDRHNQLSYWALKHLTQEADFHHRDSFCLNL